MAKLQQMLNVKENRNPKVKAQGTPLLTPNHILPKTYYLCNKDINNA